MCVWGGARGGGGVIMNSASLDVTTRGTPTSLLIPPTENYDCSNIRGLIGILFPALMVILVCILYRYDFMISNYHNNRFSNIIVLVIPLYSICYLHQFVLYNFRSRLEHLYIFRSLLISIKSGGFI